MTVVIVPVERDTMIVFARGSIPDPEALGPHVEEEMRAVRELEAEGVIEVVYRRAESPGVYLILEGSSVNAVRERVDSLPFVVEGLMTVDYEEVYPI